MFQENLICLPIKKKIMQPPLFKLKLEFIAKEIVR